MTAGITWLKQVPQALIKAHKNGDTAAIEHIARGIQEYCASVTRARRTADTRARTDAVAVRMVADITKVLNKYRTNLTDLDNDLNMNVMPLHPNNKDTTK